MFRRQYRGDSSQDGRIREHLRAIFRRQRAQQARMEASAAPAPASMSSVTTRHGAAAPRPHPQNQTRAHRGSGLGMTESRVHERAATRLRKAREDAEFRRLQLAEHRASSRAVMFEHHTGCEECLRLQRKRSAQEAMDERVQRVVAAKEARLRREAAWRERAAARKQRELMALLHQQQRELQVLQARVQMQARESGQRSERRSGVRSLDATTRGRRQPTTPLALVPAGGPTPCALVPTRTAHGGPSTHMAVVCPTSTPGAPPTITLVPTAANNLLRASPHRTTGV